MARLSLTGLRNGETLYVALPITNATRREESRRAVDVTGRIVRCPFAWPNKDTVKRKVNSAVFKMNAQAVKTLIVSHGRDSQGKSLLALLAPVGALALLLARSAR
jgi:hypothetical protein